RRRPPLVPGTRAHRAPDAVHRAPVHRAEDGVRLVASITLTPRDRSDLRLLSWGAYAPLERFVGEDEHRSIVETMRLRTGELWPFPIAPSLDDEAAAGVRGASSVDLYDPDGVLVGRVVEPEPYHVPPAHPPP